MLEIGEKDHDEDGRVDQGEDQIEVLPEIVERYSCRAYAERPVEEDKLVRILEAARLAPSACNFQEWRFVVVRDSDTRRRLAIAANRQMFVGEAPVLIVCCAETDGHVIVCENYNITK